MTITVPFFNRKNAIFVMFILCLQMSTILISMDAVQSESIEDQTSKLPIEQHEGRLSLSGNKMEEYYSPYQYKKTGSRLNPGSSLEGPLASPKSPRSNASLDWYLDREKYRQPSPMDLLGSQDYVDNINNDHSPADIGSLSALAPMQSVGPVATLTEADIATNTEDHYNQENSNVDSSADVGTQATPLDANDSVNNEFMNLQETNLGGPGTTYLIKPSDFNDVNGGWSTENSAYDQNNGTSAMEDGVKITNDIYYFSWGNASGSGTILQLDIRLYLDLVGLSDDELTITVLIGGSTCPETAFIDYTNGTTGMEIFLNDVTEPRDGSWNWTDIGNIDLRLEGTKTGGFDPINDYEIFEVWGWAYTGNPDYELDFEYSWTAADSDETNENISIYVQTAMQDSENLKAWERIGSTWSLLGNLSSNGWNNFSASYLSSATYYIKLNDSNQAGDATQNNWNIDVITLHVWSASNYVFDRELGWEGVDFDEAVEELCILTGTVGTEDLKIDVWDSANWTAIASISDADDNTWINTSISAYLNSSTIEFRFLGATESSDSSQNMWQINAALVHTSVIPTEIVDSSLASETTIYLRYSDSYRWWLIWNDSKSKTWIEDATPPYSSDTAHVNLVDPLSNGNHTFEFNATDLGTFPVTINLAQPGFQSQTFDLTFIVESNPTSISASRNGPIATVYLRYSDSYDFWLLWEDTNHTEPPTLINDTSAAIEGSYTTQGPMNGTGNHTFTFAGALVRNYQINITLNTTGYDAVLYRIQFIVERNPTAVENPSLQPGAIQPVLFGENFTFNFTWQDSNHSLPIQGASIEINETAVSESSTLGGNYFYIFRYQAMRTYGVNITLSKTGYEPMSYLLAFAVQARPTQFPVATSSDHEIHGPVDAGSSVSGQYSWIDTNSSQSVPAGNVTAFWNGISATQAHFLQSLDGYYDITIDTSEVHWGEAHNLTLQFWKYGYENRSLTVFLDIEGLAIYLEVTFTDPIIQGQDFVIEAGLYRITSSSGITLLQENGIPVAGEPIDFNVTVLFENRTEKTFLRTVDTDSSGKAIFTLPGGVTSTLDAVQGIEVDYAGSYTNRGLDSSINVPDEDLPAVHSPERNVPFMDEIWNFFLDNLLYIIVGVILLLVLGSIGSYQLWTYQTTVRKHRAINRKMQEIRMLRMVIIRHRDGVPLFSQSVFGVEKDVAEAIAGMSAAIGSFMDGLSEKTIKGAGHASGTPPEFFRMEQRGLHLLQRRGVHTAVIAISEGPLGKFMEKNITKLQLEIENRFNKEFARFFTNEQVPESQLKALAYHHLYLGLLGPLQLNVRKIRAEERDLKSEERRIVRELLAHKELVPMEVLFIDSYLSHLRDRGILEIAAAKFLLKSYKLGFIESVSIQDAMQQRQQQ